MRQDLETERLKFTEVTRGQLPLFFKLHSCPEVDQFNTMGIPVSMEITAAILKPAIENQKQTQRSIYCWGVYNKRNQAFIGEAGFNVSPLKYRRGEMHYLIMPQYWGNGFATEIVRGILNFGFDQLALHRIEAGVATENLASIRVLEKAGLLREGRHRKILPIRGEWVDNYHYAILECDLRT